jgi:hypothetical protein
LRARYIFEKFTEDSDPIQDLGIGMSHIIKKWLLNYKITNYKINSDLTIDVHDQLNLNKYKFTELPEYINFNYVFGDFHAAETKLITMRGFPKKIGGYFQTSHNNFKNLDYLPQKILLKYKNKSGYGYGLSNNNLRSMVGLPEILDCNLWVYGNKFKTLEGLPKEIKGNLFIDERFSREKIQAVCKVDTIYLY